MYGPWFVLAPTRNSPCFEYPVGISFVIANISCEQNAIAQMSTGFSACQYSLDGKTFIASLGSVDAFSPVWGPISMSLTVSVFFKDQAHAATCECLSRCNMHSTSW